MTESQQNEFKKDLEYAGRLIASATIIVGNISFIGQSLDKDQRVVYEKFNLLKQLDSGLWSTLVLTLSTLFSKRKQDCYRLLSIVNRSMDFFNDLQWKRSISLKDLETYRERLTANDGPIMKVGIIRDQYIAHIDKDPTSVSITISELNRLVNEAQALHDTISCSLSDGSVMWTPSEHTLGHGLFQTLVKYDRLVYRIRSSNVSGEAQIPTDDLLKIVRGTPD